MSFLEIDNLSYSNSKGLRILNNINLDMEDAKIFGLLGPSGSGKTTLLKHIIGILPSFGKIKISNNVVPFDGMYKKIGYMPQEDALYEDLTCYDNIMFFARLFGVKNPDKTTLDILQICELLPHKNKLVSKCSGGTKRRMSLALSLVGDPKFLILDEPTVGIDPVLRNKFWDFFYTLKKRGRSMIVTTHIMSDAEKCDYICVMKAGEIVFFGTTSELKKKTKSENMDEAYVKINLQIKS